MSVGPRIESLKLKHASVDRELDLESQRPWPDTSEMKRLKREKLRLKDEVSRLGDHHA